MPPAATVVICTVNRAAPLERCLAAVAALDHRDYEILVIDNGTMPESSREIASRFGAKHVHEPAMGVNRARNRGLREATGDVVAFIDDDATADRHWLSRLLRPYENDRVGAATGRIIAGEPSDPSTGLIADLAGFDCGTESMQVDASVPDWFERANFGGIGNGANMSFRRSAVAAWGGFDERIGFGTLMRGFGEHNAFYRVAAAGFTIMYEPEAIVFHPVAADLRRARARQTNTIATSVAYMLLLFAELPEHRRRLLRYLTAGARQSRREWRPIDTRPIRLGWPREILAAARGALLYVRWRLAQRRP
jgi:glycosyltransferase involved in cell wall biosynthesis